MSVKPREDQSVKPREDHYSSRIFELFERHELQPELVHPTQRLHTALCMVAAGYGVSIVPAGLQFHETPGVRYRPIDDPYAVVSFAVAMRKSAVSRLAEDFRDAAEDSAADLVKSHPQFFHDPG